MLDRDLTELYEVETRVLNQAVGRNIDRFSNDFIFELTREEVVKISQIVTSSKMKNISKQIIYITIMVCIFLFYGCPIGKRYYTMNEKGE
jgi:hypothetical protein